MVTIAALTGFSFMLMAFCLLLSVRLRQLQQERHRVYTTLVGTILSGGTQIRPFEPGRYSVSIMQDATTGVQYLRASRES